MNAAKWLTFNGKLKWLFETACTWFILAIGYFRYQLLQLLGIFTFMDVLPRCFYLRCRLQLWKSYFILILGHFLDICSLSYQLLLPSWSLFYSWVVLHKVLCSFLDNIYINRNLGTIPLFISVSFMWPQFIKSFGYDGCSSW